jgi:pimeloyl-ACP methyl ester carboxylesterase
VHGTGFCASVWDAIAIDLVDDFDVVAVDRRGHGASAKPVGAYALDDLADDVVALIDALDLQGAYGIGHSAGGTDLLLAAPQRPHAFAKLFLIEPTVMDPHDPTSGLVTAPGPEHADLERLRRRRATFPSRQAARERLEDRGIFAGWHSDLLDAYISDGLEALPDGQLSLRCTPTNEAEMLRHIAAAMNGTHPTEPFQHLSKVGGPVLIATTEFSNQRYKRMANTASRLLDDSTIEHIAGIGHAAPQVAPGLITAMARRFWKQGTPP